VWITFGVGRGEWGRNPVFAGFFSYLEGVETWGLTVEENGAIMGVRGKLWIKVGITIENCG